MACCCALALPARLALFSSSLRPLPRARSPARYPPLSRPIVLSVFTSLAPVYPRFACISLVRFQGPAEITRRDQSSMRASTLARSLARSLACLLAYYPRDIDCSGYARIHRIPGISHGIRRIVAVQLSEATIILHRSRVTRDIPRG